VGQGGRATRGRSDIFDKNTGPTHHGGGARETRAAVRPGSQKTRGFSRGKGGAICGLGGGGSTPPSGGLGCFGGKHGFQLVPPHGSVFLGVRGGGGWGDNHPPAGCTRCRPGWGGPHRPAGIFLKVEEGKRRGGGGGEPKNRNLWDRFRVFMSHWGSVLTKGGSVRRIFRVLFGKPEKLARGPAQGDGGGTVLWAGLGHHFRPDVAGKGRGTPHRGGGSQGGCGLGGPGCGLTPPTGAHWGRGRGQDPQKKKTGTARGTFRGFRGPGGGGGERHSGSRSGGDEAGLPRRVAGPGNPPPGGRGNPKTRMGGGGGRWGRTGTGEGAARGKFFSPHTPPEGHGKTPVRGGLW